MKVKQIYENFMVPKNLQEHMLRVASLAKILIDNWEGKEIDKDSIIKASLFHDIAKPMNFDLAKQAQYGMSEEDIKRLADLQTRIKSEYGTNEHTATVKICEEIGLSQNSIKYVNDLEWVFIPRLIQENDIESLIPIYCDMRIGPKGILKLLERLEDLKNRTNSEEYQENIKYGTLLENLLTRDIKVNVNQINDSQLQVYFAEFLNINI